MVYSNVPEIVNAVIKVFTGIHAVTVFMYM